MSRLIRLEALLASLAVLLCIDAVAVERKDPRTRDEDISGAVLSVDYFARADGLIEYVYRLQSPPTNKGIILDLDIELACEEPFAAVELPFPADAQGYDFPPQDAVPHTPVAVIGDFGSAFSYGIASDGSASWGLFLKPGEVRDGLRLISPARPGMRNYRLIPAMDNDESWSYPPQPDSSIPWIDEFTVSGTIAAPGCPGVTQLPPQ